MPVHLKGLVLHPERFPTRDHYPFSLPILQRMQRLTFDKPVTFLVGENGSGKSTLLEALAQACGIHIWRTPSGPRYEVNPWEEELHSYLGVEWTRGPVPGSFFGSDIARDFALLLDEWAASDPGQLKYFGGKSLVTQSHGQSFMSLFRARYKIKGLYLLDEPETALSPRSQLELLRIITEFANTGEAQFIIATHSPLLLACPGALIYSFDHQPVRSIAYEETEHYNLYRSFLLDRTAWVS